MSGFNLEIVTPEREFFNGEIESVNFKTLSGREQILANHIPYASGLLPSVVKVTQGGTTKFVVLSGGFVEFSNNKAVILADAAEWPEEIDAERAHEAYDRAKARLKAKGENVDKIRAQMALLRATARLKAEELRKHK